MPTMLRLTEVKLPLDHTDAQLHAAILARLGIAPSLLLGYTIFRRAVDARKRSAIHLIYTLDITVADEDALQQSYNNINKNKYLQNTPDTGYRFVAQAPARLQQRPVVIGTGPCGLFAGLLLAQMGFNPIILERGKAVRERTQDTWGLWRKSVLNAESNVQFGEGGAGTFSDGKLTARSKTRAFSGAKC